MAVFLQRKMVYELECMGAHGTATFTSTCYSLYESAFKYDKMVGHQVRLILVTNNES